MCASGAASRWRPPARRPSRPCTVSSIPSVCGDACVLWWTCVSGAVCPQAAAAVGRSSARSSPWWPWTSTGTWAASGAASAARCSTRSTSAGGCPGPRPLVGHGGLATRHMMSMETAERWASAACLTDRLSISLSAPAFPVPCPWCVPTEMVSPTVSPTTTPCLGSSVRAVRSSSLEKFWR